MFIILSNILSHATHVQDLVRHYNRSDRYADERVFNKAKQTRNKNRFEEL